MADVAAQVSVAGQIRLVAALRWKIMRNYLRRKGNVLDFIGILTAGLCAALLVVGVGFAVSFGAHAAVSTGHFIWLTLLFFGIIAFWQIVPLFAAGFGVNFEFRTLLRFPLSLSAFYLIALAYGLADFAALASVCWLFAMVLGIGTADLALVPAAVMICALVLLMSVTLERLVGSWYERLISRRATRELFFGFVILLSISGQFIKPLIERFHDGPPPFIIRLIPYVALTPPVLAGSALNAAQEHDVGGLLLRSVGLLLYVLLFSIFLWRRFATQYRGEELSESVAPTRSAARLKSAAIIGMDVLYFLPPSVAAMLRKDFQYLLRNGFLMMSLFMPPFLVFLFSAQFAGAHPWAIHRGVSRDMFFPGMIGYLLLMLMMPAYNCFAYEGKGVQTYFTAPVRFRDVFLGKNIMHMGIVLFEVALSVFLLVWRIGSPSAPVLAATLVGMAFAAPGQFALANWASLCYPRKLEFGSMRGQHGSGVAIWVGFGSQFLLGGVCSLVLFMGRWTNNPWLPTEAFAALAAASIAGYFASLDGLSDLAERKKENLIEILCR